MAKVNINDVLQGLIQPIGSLKGGSTYPVTAADQIWVYTDHDTHRPLDEYLGAMKTEAEETTQTFVSNATALTEGKIAKTSIVGGNAAKCKVGDIVLVADGGIYKIKAIDETNITLVIPALASYATASACIIKIDSEKRTYTSNIPLPTDESTPVYADYDGALYPLVYNYQNSASGHTFELLDYISGEAVIRVGYLKPDGTVEISVDNSSFLLTAPLPDTLDKSYLIGVGTYGEEVIEIGDNLTLVDGVLSATSGGVNFLQATLDEPDVFGHSEGTYTGTIDPNKVNVAILPDPKNKYTLLTKITDEGVGSATIITDRQPVTLSFANNEIHTSPAGTYCHYISVISDTVDIILNYYSTDGYRYSDLEELKNRFQGRIIPCSGFVKINNKFQNARGIDLRNNTIIYFDNDTGKNVDIDLTGRIKVYDQVFSVETGMEVGNFDPGPL